jgi:hypothetical protein
MGWKAFSILIKPATDISHEALLQTLEFTNFTKIDDEPYDVAIYPDKGKIFIGNYNDTLIISEFNLPQQFCSEELSDTEKKLINIFPGSEIAAVVLHSGTNYWGYSIVKDGKKIRARMGDADNGTTLDYGEPVEEELELLSKSRLNDIGQRQYFLNDNPDEPYSEDQVGENFVFEIYKRYTGESLDNNDEFLFETNLSGYQISAPKKVSSSAQPAQGLITKETKPWWKFW